MSTSESIAPSVSLSKKEAEHIDSLTKEAWEVSRTSPNQGLELARKALELSQKGNYKKGIAYSKAAIGACNTWLSNYNEALENAHEAQKELHALEEFVKEFEVLYVISAIFYYLGDYDKQADYCYRSYELAKQVDHKDGMANALNGLGTVYYTIGENEKAVETLKEGLSIVEDSGNKAIMTRILDGLGTAYSNLQDYENALAHMNRTLLVLEELDIKQTLSYAHDGTGTIHLNLGDQDKAIEHFQKSLQLRQEMGFRAGESESLYHIGQVFYQAGDFLKAQKHYKEALEIAEEIDSKQLCYRCHLGLSDLYEQMGNLKEFAYHFRAYHRYKEQHSAEENQKKVKTIELETRMKQMLEEKSVLEEQNQELADFNDSLQTLSEVGKELTSTFDIDAILVRIYERVNSLMDANVLLIGLYDEDTDILSMRFAMEEGKRLPEVQFKVSDDSSRLACWTVANKKEAVIRDYEKDIERYTGKTPPPAVGKRTETIVYLPLMVQEKVIGVLSVQSFESNAYSDYHQNVIRNIGTYAAIALQNAEIYNSVENEVAKRTEEIEKNHRNAQLLSEIGQQLISTLEIETVFEHLHDNVNQLMDATIFGIRLYDPESQTISYRYEMESGERHDVISISMDNKNNYSVWCVEHKQPLHIVDHLNEYQKYVEEINVVDGEMPESLLFQPLMKGDDVLGVISVQSFEKFAYTEYHLNILKTLGSYMVIALENAKNYETMEAQVKKRTRDVVRLSQLGKEIISYLSVEQIVSSTYDILNTMMDAPSFGIGVLDEEKGIITFPGYIEEGELLTGGSYELHEEDRMTIACFNNEYEILIGDYEKEHSQYVKQNYTPKMGKSVESLIYLPLKVKDKKIGVITVQSFQKNAYTDYHFNIVKNLAVYAAIALDNARLYEGLEDIVKERTEEVIQQKEEIERNYRSTETLSRIGKDITSSLSIQDIVAGAYSNVNTLMNAECFGIGIYDPAKNEIQMPGFHEKGQVMEDFAYGMDDHNRLAVQCFAKKSEIFIRNYQEEYEDYITGIQRPVSGKDSTSIIYLPVYSKEKVIGVITVQSFEANAFTENHLNILRNLAVYVGIAIENATLYFNLEEKVRERTKEVIEQKEIIEEKNKSITDSIKYAKRIQDATLPQAATLSQYFDDSFILFKPKDIVSGDFYWFESYSDEEGKRKALFAVVDCTGHGVPGAFMSIIGHNALNQIVKEYNITEPGRILEKLDQILQSSLSQKSEHGTIRDGMDIALCSLDLDSNQLEFAGAFNPLWIIREGELLEYKGDKMAIGSGITDNHRYHTHEIKLASNDRIYIFSDGYADQFGGPRGKKFKYNRFKEALVEMHNDSMKEQHLRLESMLEEWRGDIEQIDDVCVLGVRVG